MNVKLVKKGNYTDKSLQPLFRVCVIFFYFFFLIMATTSEKTHPSVCRYALWQLENLRTAYARILKLYILHVHEKLADPFFSSRSGVIPIFRLCHCIYE